MKPWHVSLLLLTGCGGGIIQIGPEDLRNEVETGDEIQISPGDPAAVVATPDIELEWVLAESPDPSVLVPIGPPDPSDESESWFFRAVGPGETVVGLGIKQKGLRDPSLRGGLTFSFTVRGEPVDGEPGPEADAHLENIEVMGGFGNSIESGAALQDLRLWPTDMVRGPDGHLYVSSEGRLWDIDTTAGTGTIVLDMPGDGGALPTGTEVVSAAPLSDGGFMAVVYAGRTGHIIRISGDRSSHTVLESATAASDDVFGYFGRIRASSDGSRWVTFFDRQQVRSDGKFPFPDNGDHVPLQLSGDGEFLPKTINEAHGLDRQGRAAGWLGRGVLGATLMLIAESGTQELWTASNVELPGLTAGQIARRFIPVPQGDGDTWAPVWQLDDSSWWSFTTQMPDGETSRMANGKVLPSGRGRGLYRHK